MTAFWRLKEAASGQVLISHLEIGSTFWKRLVGLQFRSQLLPGRGLLLAPCNSIHTFFLRFPIDVTFLDDRGKVLRIRSSVRPWRIVPPVRRAHAVLETAAGNVSWVEDAHLCLAAPGTLVHRVPKALRRWVSVDD